MALEAVELLSHMECNRHPSCQALVESFTRPATLSNIYEYEARQRGLVVIVHASTATP